MTERILLSIIAIIMFALTLKRGDKSAKLLTAGLTLGILITWTGFPVIIAVGMVIYMVTGLMISFVNLKSQELNRLNQLTIIIGGIFAFGANLFSMMHWPYAQYVRLSMIIPLVLYLISLYNGMIRSKEIGYLTIINVEFMLRLTR